MPTHKKARELANAFEAAYPDELPKRLQWWCCVLGIDRVRFLRMMGMSATEAKERENQEWDTILQDPNLADTGWWVEGKLHELLSLFDYDWKALSERLHQPLVQTEGAEPTRISRTRGTIEPLRYVPNGDGTELPLNIMAENGAQSLSALFAYLSNSMDNSGHQV